MAIVQISRIQIRRGQRNQGEGLPQLASGELGWAIDTRELFIGNGSVAEGAPSVGNTKILTEYDDIFSLARTYRYRPDSPYIETGLSPVSPTERTLQARLDDVVTIRSFGALGVDNQDATPYIQKAIDQLYLNSDKLSERSRVVLHFPAGLYVLTGTVYIPSFASLLGDGQEKTVFKQTGNFPLFKTVNDSSLGGQPAASSTTTYNTQARRIYMAHMSIVQESNQSGLILDSCRESQFDNIDFVGSWTIGASYPSSYDQNANVEILSFSSMVGTRDVRFTNCQFKNAEFGILSRYDIESIHIDKCKFQELYHAVSFGVNMTPGASGMTYGAIKSLITNSQFTNVAGYGIWIEEGYDNQSRGNNFIEVGNEGSDDGNPSTAILRFRRSGNSSHNDVFSRTNTLSTGDNYLQSNVVYVPEIEGYAEYTLPYHSITFGQASGSGSRIFRLPGYKDQTFTIPYQVRGLNNFFAKTGILYICVATGQSPSVTIEDDYNFSGTPSEEDLITFSVDFLDADVSGGFDGISVLVQNPTQNQYSMSYTVKIQKYEFI